MGDTVGEAASRIAALMEGAQAGDVERELRGALDADREEEQQPGLLQVECHQSAPERQHGIGEQHRHHQRDRGQKMNHLVRRPTRRIEVVLPLQLAPAERENGKAAWLMGASFITEGAIPFAAADPLRVIPSIMAGSAVTGAIAMATDVTLRAPHGGIFVLFAVDQVLWFLVALAAGVLVAAGLVIALKSLTESKEEIEELDELAV